MKAFIWIFIGGGLGSCLRYSIQQLLKNLSTLYPIGTLCANVLGCFLIGVFVGTLEKWGAFKDPAHFLFIVGFTGGLTTFSSFILENVTLFKSSLYSPLVYSMASMGLGILFISMGVLLAKQF